MAIIIPIDLKAYLLLRLAVVRIITNLMFPLNFMCLLIVIVVKGYFPIVIVMRSGRSGGTRSHNSILEAIVIVILIEDLGIAINFDLNVFNRSEVTFIKTTAL